MKRIERLVTILEIAEQSKKFKGTNYFKTIIKGNTGYYYAHPVYGHSDYNKTRLFDITEDNTELVNLFFNLINN